MEIEVEGRNTEEAVREALKKLGVSRERVKVQVLEKGKGFFGFLKPRSVKVKVTLLGEDTKESVQRMLRKLFDIMKIRPEIRVREKDDKIFFQIRGAGASTLIGKEGRALDAFQYIINLLMKKSLGDMQKKVIIDIEGYKARKRRELVKMAKKIAERVKITKKKIALPPMSAYKRHIIHEALQHEEGVLTLSEGEGEERRVVIIPKDED